MCHCPPPEGSVLIVEICNNLLKGLHPSAEVIEDFRGRHIKPQIFIGNECTNLQCNGTTLHFLPTCYIFSFYWDRWLQRRFKMGQRVLITVHASVRRLMLLGSTCVAFIHHREINWYVKKTWTLRWMEAENVFSCDVAL